MIAWATRAVTEQYSWHGIDAIGRECTARLTIMSKNCTRCTLAKMPSRRAHAPMGNLLASRPLEVVAIDYTHLEKIRRWPR